MYVMTWGDFCLMSRGRGEKSNNKRLVDRLI